MNVDAGGFYGRRALLARLERELAQVAATGRGRMLAVRGRRQVGKSRLLTHFVETCGRPYLYTTAVKNASPGAQLAALTRDVLASTTPLPEVPVLFASPPGSWDEFFGRLRLTLQGSPAVVVIDEFPWAAQADPTLEGTLQNAWDRTLEGLPVLLVVVGSDIAMMERLTEHDRPLFGRAGIVVVQPFDPYECAELLGADRTAVEAFDAHLVTGGYPRLLGRLAASPSAEDFVLEQLRDETSDLAVQAQLSLDAEFPPDSQARRILAAIGTAEVGPVTFSRVTQTIDGDTATVQTAVTRGLKILAGVGGVIAVDVPAGAAPNSRLRRYRVADPYLRFWFRFVAPQLANIARGRGDLAIDAFRRGWPSWRGKAIEPVVRAAVLRLASDLDRLDDADAVGGWWNRDHSTEVDLVATHGPRVRAVGSVKWRTTTPFDADDAAVLRGVRQVVPGADDAALVAVCPAGVTDEAGVDLVLRADDLLAAWGVRAS
ncbi:ATP-binding protein [Jiangella anatolica]|uniref:ATPase n=1 Tax=Jiangella anatolica TaxID=2670374 RepID=A0A2W2CD46_9ACTN|nr:ATP-binding protein [Jiangella anatolica]PZF83596.1 ATPase [Jiangella anatolica]